MRLANHSCTLCFACVILLCVLWIPRGFAEEGEKKAVATRVSDEIREHVDPILLWHVQHWKELRRQNYKDWYDDKKLYNQVVAKSLEHVAEFFPEISEIKVDVDGRRYGVWAHFGDVMFRVPRSDRLLVGWITIWIPDGMSWKAKVVACVVPLPAEKSEFTDLWKARKTGAAEKAWVTEVLESALNLAVTDIEVVRRGADVTILKANGFKPDDESPRRMEVVLTPDFLQIEVKVFPDVHPFGGRARLRRTPPWRRK